MNELEAVKAFRDLMERTGHLSESLAECIDEVIADIEEEQGITHYDLHDTDNDEIIECVGKELFEFPQEIR